MKPLIAALIFPLAACHHPQPTPVGVTLAWPDKTVKHAVMTVGGRNGQNQDVISPFDVVKEGAAAKDDAKDYVLWDKSKPENISRLTLLSGAIDVAMLRMNQTHILTGRYKQEDVLSLKQAVEALRHFLATKGD